MTFLDRLWITFFKQEDKKSFPNHFHTEQLRCFVPLLNMDSKQAFDFIGFKNGVQFVQHVSRHIHKLTLLQYCKRRFDNIHFIRNAYAGSR